MQPKSEKPSVNSNQKMPSLHLTPSGNHQKKPEISPQPLINQYLLKAHHEIPSTPPPQAESKPLEFFSKRIS